MFLLYSCHWIFIFSVLTLYNIDLMLADLLCLSRFNRICLSFSSMRGRISLDTIRPLPMFIGISGHAFCFAPEAFSPPAKKLDKSTYEKVKSRIRLNFAFFLSNYALVTAGVGIVVALMHPGMLLAVGLVWSLWGFHNYLISNELVLFGQNIGTLVSITHRSNALIVLTILVVTWKCLLPAITFVAISGLIVFSHALMRDPNHIEMSNDFQRQKFADDSDDDEGALSESEVLVERPVVRGDVI